VVEAMSEYYGKKYKKNVTIITVRKSDKRYKHHVAANNIVPYALIQKTERKKPEVSKAMNQQVKRYKGRNDITRRNS